MADRLVVIIGAGASRGSPPGDVTTSVPHPPPLVGDLFKPSPGVAGEILPEYPLVNLAAADLRDRGDSLAIEAVLRERYRDSDHDLDRRMFAAIPSYLQDLLHAVSYQYTAFPQNYQSLVTNLLRLREVLFVSLNYDVLLDNVLHAIAPRSSISWYIDPSRHWWLIKL